MRLLQGEVGLLSEGNILGRSGQHRDEVHLYRVKVIGAY